MKLVLLGASTAVAVLLEIGLPFVLAFFIARQFKVSWKYFAFGALIFILVQIPHTGLLAGLTFLANRLIPPHALSHTAQVAINSVTLGLLAGIFEEFGRYFTFKYWLKDIRSFRQALMFGAGWGGIESIGVGIAVAISIASLLMTANLNPARLPGQAVRSLSIQQKRELREGVRQAKEQIDKMPSYSPLIGLLERVFAIILHLSFTLIVLQAFAKNRFFYVWLAVIYHALVDGVAVALAKNVLVAESVVGVFALFSLVIIFLLCRGEEVSTQEYPPSSI